MGSFLPRGPAFLHRLWIKPAETVVWLAVGIYAVFFSYYSIMKHYAFLTSAWDLGIYEQALWTTAFQGRLFYETPDLSFNPGGSLLGTHFSPILFLILPLYALVPRAETLLILQSVALGLGAIPVYRLARIVTGRALYAVVFAYAYLLAPALHGINSFDFHVEALFPVLALWAFYHLIRGSRRWFLLLTMVSMTVIEFAPVIVVFVGLYLLLPRVAFRKGSKTLTFLLQGSRSLLGVQVVGLGIVGLLVALGTKWAINPAGSVIPSTFAEVVVAGEASGSPTSSVGSLVSAIFLTNWPNKFSYLLHIFGPLAFLPLFSPSSLVMVAPWILSSFVTTFPFYYSIDYQYSSFVLPYAIVAAILGFRGILGLVGNADRLGRRLAGAILVLTLSFSGTLSVVSPLRVPTPLPQPTEHDLRLRGVLSMIPQDASVVAQSNIFPHLSRRVQLYAYLPSTAIVPEYVLADMFTAYYTGPLPNPTNDPRVNSIASTIERLVANYSYGVLVFSDGILLLKRDYSGKPVLASSRYDYRTLTPVAGQVREYPTASSKKVIFHEGGMKGGIFWVGPYRLFPAGSYSVTFVLRIESGFAATLVSLDVSTSSGTLALTQRNVTREQVASQEDWVRIILNFELPESSYLEFRGTYVDDSAQVALDYVEVELLQAPPFRPT